MEVMDAIRQRRSVRRYASDPIPDEKLSVILEAARLAPTACNYQPFKLIVVKDDATRRRLVPACAGQAFIAEAPIIIVGCAFEDRAYQRQAGSYSSFAIDLSIVFDHITLAALDQGLGTCWIGAFDEQAVRKVVGVPQDVRVVALTPLGAPAEEPADAAAEANRGPGLLRQVEVAPPRSETRHLPRAGVFVDTALLPGERMNAPGRTGPEGAWRRWGRTRSRGQFCTRRSEAALLILRPADAGPRWWPASLRAETPGPTRRVEEYQSPAASMVPHDVVSHRKCTPQ